MFELMLCGHLYFLQRYITCISLYVRKCIIIPKISRFADLFVAKDVAETRRRKRY